MQVDVNRFSCHIRHDLAAREKLLSMQITALYCKGEKISTFAVSLNL